VLTLLTLVLVVVIVCTFALAGETRPMLYASIVLTVCNDIIFVPMGEVGNSAFSLLAKSWREEFIVAGFLSYLLWRGRGREGVALDAVTTIVLVAVSLVTVIGLAIGARSSGLFVAFTIARSYVLPLLLPISLYISGAFSRDRNNVAFWILLILGAVMSIYATYVVSTFTGRITDLWYYDFVAGEKVSNHTAQRLIAYQFIRDGNLRATGFLISAVDYSIFSGIIAALALSGALYFTRPLKRIAALLLLMICIPAIELSQTRAGYGVIGLATLAGFSFRYLRIRWSYAYPILMIGLVAATLLAVQRSPGSFDSSLAGRPGQLFDAIGSFRPLGWGFGTLENNGPTYKDSLFLSALGTFGVFFVGYVGPLVLVHKSVAGAYNRISRFDDAQGYVIGAFSAFSAMWYIFGFHYTLGNVGFYVLLLMSYAAVAQAGSAQRRSAESDLQYPAGPEGFRNDGFAKYQSAGGPLPNATNGFGDNRQLDANEGVERDNSSYTRQQQDPTS
jgi:hypothetical protein